MKRFLTILLASLMVFSVSAKKYKNSIGLTTGFSYGFSYKTMVKPHFTIATDLSYGFNIVGPGGLMDFFGNATNFAYQGDITKGQNIDLDWFVGGGTLLGACADFSGGTWGINAFGGIEINFVNAPLSITADFRPGYGLHFIGGGGGWDFDDDDDIDWGALFGGGGGGGGMTLMHTFITSINFGIRYTF